MLMVTIPRAGVAVLLLLCVAATATSVVSNNKAGKISEEIFFHEWELWKTGHHKLYVTKAEHDSRYTIFKDNLDYINEFNSQPHSHVLGLNNFADMSHEEYLSMLGEPVVRGSVQKQQPVDSERHVERLYNPRDSLDYRKLGAVTSVKNQGQCGSCWAFSTVGAAEGAHALAGNGLVDLSVQQVADCSYEGGNSGCNGGDTRAAMDYVIEQGLQRSRDYPYRASESTCHYDDRDVVASFRKWIAVREGDENDLARVLKQYGPVSVAIDAGHRSLQFYRDGIYYEPTCSSYQLDHGVLLVGYGSSDEGDYWIVKNSWGTEYGESGYVRMARNLRNHCGIATYATALVSADSSRTYAHGQ